MRQILIVAALKVAVILLAIDFGYGQGGPPLPAPDNEIAKIQDYRDPGESWAKALEDALNDKDYVYFPERPGGYVFTEIFNFNRLLDLDPAPDIIRSGGKTIYGEGTLIRGAGNNRLFLFGSQGSSGDPDICFENITIAGLSFDANGFVGGGSLIHWGGDDDVENILLQNLNFFDSSLDDHEGGTDDWSINIGGFGALRDFYVRGCTHGLGQAIPSRHQFCVGGFKQDFDSGPINPVFATVDGLTIEQNLIPNGSESVTIGVEANRDSYCQIRNVKIADNFIINAWRFAINLGFDAVDSSDGSPRWMYVDGARIENNYVEWNSEGSYSSQQSAPGIRVQAGDGFIDELPIELADLPVGIKNVVITGNVVLDQDHEFKQINGVTVGGGINDQPLEIEIVDNLLPAIGLQLVDHSDILIANNFVDSTTGETTPLNLGTYPFDRENDVPVLVSSLQLELDSLDLSFRFFVRDHDKDSFIFFHDEDNFLKLNSETDRSLVLRIGGRSRKVVDAGIIQAGTVYEIRIFNSPISGDFNEEIDGTSSPNDSMPSGGHMLTCNYRVQGLSHFQSSGSHEFTAAELPIKVIGASFSGGPLLISDGPVFGNVWDIKFSDASSQVFFPARFESNEFEAWIDRSNVGMPINGILTPLDSYVFYDSNLPVPKTAIAKSLDGLDFSFSFYVSNLASAPYLFYHDQDNYIQARPNGSMLLVENGFSRSLLWSGRITEDQSHHIRIFDVADGPDIVLRTELDHNASINSGPSIPIPGENILESDLQFNVTSLGGAVGRTANRLSGSIWDTILIDNNVQPWTFEKYEGATRNGGVPWQDTCWLNFATRNNAIPTPYLPFQFDQLAIPVISPEQGSIIEIPMEKLDLSFRLFIDDLSQDSTLFYYDTQHLLKLRSEGRQLRLRHGELEQNISFVDRMEEDGSYDIRVFVEDMNLKVFINGSLSGPVVELPANPEPFRVISIGGRINFQDSTAVRLFEGRIWDVAFKRTDRNLPDVFYSGHFQTPGIGPWDDLTAQPINMTIFEFE